MTSTQVVMFAVKASLALTVFATGLSARRGDGTWLFRHPALLARSIFSMNVILPLMAVSVAIAFSLNRAVEIAIVALAISPVPPILPNKMIKSGGGSSYAISLLVTSALLAVITIPASVWALGALLATPMSVAPEKIAGIVLQGVLLPLVAGLAVRRFAPSVARRAAKDVARIGLIALVVAIIPVLVTVWPAMRTLIGNGTLVAITVMTAIGLAVGHLLGGPLDEGRPVLALATASRHPAIAAAIAQAAFPDAPLVPAAVLLDLIVVAVISIPYTRWVKRALDDTIAIPSIAFHERRRSTGGATSHITRERRARPVQRYDRR